MFINHKGDSILEWLIVGCIAVGVIGFSIMQVAKVTSDGYQSLDQGIK